MSVNNDWDVIVVGGGIAGCMAAVASARQGAKTLLIERDGCLGGTMTTSLVGPMMTFHSSKEQVVKGLAQEVVERLIEMKASPGHIIDSSGYVQTVTPFDHEAMKIVLQRMVLGSGATVILHTSVQDVLMNGKSIQGVVVHNKSGRAEFHSKIVIDTSGDGDVASMAGVPCQFGRPSDGLVQPVSLMFKMTDVDLPTLKAYLVLHPEVARLGKQGSEIYENQELIAVCAFNDLLQKWIESNHLSLQREYVLVFSANHPDDLIVNMTRVQEIDPINAWDLTRAEFEAREQIFTIVEFLKSNIPGFAHARLITSGSRIGIRESRRIIGDYVLTADDITESKRFEDAIARSAYPIDIHSMNDEGQDKHVFLQEGAFYEIPYRCLVPLHIENLLVAGRCISTSSEANASIRVSPNCMAFGQAAGTAAALSLQQEVTPRKLNTALLRKILIDQKAFL